VLGVTFEDRLDVADDVLEAIRKKFSDTLAPVVIRADEKIREAASLGSPITEFAPNSPAAKDYAALASYIMESEPAVVNTPVATAVPAGSSHETLTEAHQPEHTMFDHAPHQGHDGYGINTHNTGATSDRYTGGLTDGVVTIDHGDLFAGDAHKSSTPPKTPRRSGTETISRAAELAARARQLSAKSAELSRKIESDPDVSRVMRDIDRPERIRVVIGQTTPKMSDETGGQHKYGAVPMNNGVWFIQPGGPEMEFCVAGDHNGWVPSATKLVYNEQRESHQAFIIASPGPMRYRLVVNGEWISDPYNPNSQANPYGGRDSIVIVPPSSEGAKKTTAAGGERR